MKVALQRAKMVIEFIYPIRNTTNWSCEGNRRIPWLAVLPAQREGVGQVLFAFIRGGKGASEPGACQRYVANDLSSLVPAVLGGREREGRALEALLPPVASGVRIDRGHQAMVLRGADPVLLVTRPAIALNFTDLGLARI